MNPFKKKLDDFFEISKRGSSFKIETFAGIATFLAMAYILTVNPVMMQGFGALGFDRTAALIIATAFGAIVGTLLLAVLAKVPFAQAPGMGLNAMIGGLMIAAAFGTGTAFTYQNLMAIVFLSGLIFLLVSFVPVGKNAETGEYITAREKIFDGIPPAIRSAIPVGIGLFIAFIGLQNAKVIIGDPAGTLVKLVSFNSWSNPEALALAANAVVCLFGLIVIAVLSRYKVKGAIIIGVLAATVLAMPLGVVDFDVIAGSGGVSWKFWENFGKFFSFSDTEGAFGMLFKGGFDFPANSLFTVIVLIITFSMIDMFDTIGTVVGCASNAGLIDKTGKPLNYSKIMYSDSIATVTGAVFGTSTVTTFVESGAGVAVGGKTGFTALVVAGLFLLSIFVLPVFAFIPSAAAASALVYVGVLMIGRVKDIDFHDVRVAVPAFIIIIGMPLTYSITNGIGLGIISYVLISLVCYVVDIVKFKKSAGEKPKWPISLVTGIIVVLFLLYFLLPQSI
ncbi:MAG: NCS2 family permease [Clostridiales bacterium]|jgi:AGZA family xanthine/uracil permease-like MFS transporter|nr:NCS2 family permease [Clostridiales bacterium]